MEYQQSCEQWSHRRVNLGNLIFLVGETLASLLGEYKNEQLQLIKNAHKSLVQIYVFFFVFFCWLRIPNLYSTVYKLIFVWYCLIIIAYLICNINIYKHLSYFQASPSYFEKNTHLAQQKTPPGERAHCGIPGIPSLRRRETSNLGSK